MEVKAVITINRPPKSVYAFWRDVANLPRFMQHLESVQVLDQKRSRWIAKAAAGQRVSWDAEILADQPNALIAWRSLPGATVENAGAVRFTPAPGDRGTEVRVELSYVAPGGAPGAVVAKLLGEEPSQQIQDDLRHFKQVMETGEITRSDASVKGGGPAQPPVEAHHSAEAIQR